MPSTMKENATKCFLLYSKFPINTIRNEIIDEFVVTCLEASKTGHRRMVENTTYIEKSMLNCDKNLLPNKYGHFTYLNFFYEYLRCDSTIWLSLENTLEITICHTALIQSFPSAQYQSHLNAVVLWAICNRLMKMIQNSFATHGGFESYLGYVRRLLSSFSCGRQGHILTSLLATKSLKFTHMLKFLLKIVKVFWQYPLGPKLQTTSAFGHIELLVSTVSS